MSADQFPYPVYTGIWINWSNGTVMGSTMTLPQENANLFIGAFALFVAVVSTHIWNLVCFTLHACYSTPTPRDTLHHQRQAIIWNSSSATANSVITLSKLAWAWRNLSTAYWRLIPLRMSTVFLAVATALASIFSSRIAIGSEVLLSGSQCAIPAYDAANYSTLAAVYYPYLTHVLTESATYATQCYTGISTDLRCELYVKPYFPIAVNGTASCPFSDLCLANNSNLLLDTGLLDSHHDLRLNAPDHGRFSYKRVLHCAPL